MTPLRLAARRLPAASSRALLFRTAARPNAFRLRAYATAAPDGPALTATNRAETSLKRFWKTVGVAERDGALAVTLDGRPLRTPSGNTLLLPPNKRLVAALIAHEWENQAGLLKPHALPMTSLASRALDAMRDPAPRAAARAALLAYLDTDTLLFHAPPPDPASLSYASSDDTLFALQNTHWAPLIAWARAAFACEVLTFDSILSTPQPPATHAALAAAVDALDCWELAALERTVYLTKSLIIGLALVKRRITADEAAQASHVEVNSQISRWGEVEDSHDVDYHDVRRQLGSAAVLLSNV